MRERGFMPFSAAGALIVLLVLGMIGQAAWSRHQRSLNVIDEISDSAIFTIAAEVQGDLKAILKYAVYRALWDVSKRANDYDSTTRERAVEQLATQYFGERVTEIGPAYTRHDMRVELDLPNSSTWPVVNIEEVEGGYALAQAELPEGTLLRLRSRDNSLSLVLPLGEIGVFVDSRYFLLQERMDDFVERRGDICTWWGIMEYLTAWGGAWLNGKVELSDSRSQAFFETAWAIHEFNTFGSSDYWAAAEGLIDAMGEASDILDELNYGALEVTTICAADLDIMCGYLERSIGAIEGAAACLGETRRHVGSARDTAFNASENLEWALEHIHSLLLNAIGSIAETRAEILNAGGRFDQLLEFIATSASDDVVMSALYQNLTSRVLNTGYPTLEEQVEWGVRGTLTKLAELEQAVTNISAGIGVSGLETLDGLFEEVTTSIEAILFEPSPQRWVTFTGYEGNPPHPVDERAPVYIDDESDGTIGALKIVIDGAKGNFNKMEQLSQQYEPSPTGLQEFEVEEELISRLERSPPEFSIDREGLYEFLPPAPINPSPGLSVFHDFEVKSVKYSREDPAGWLGSPTATPIPLWFIGVTLWWAQWDITLELEDGVVEEIFDFDNPALPRYYGAYYVHKPLAYRYEIPDEQFSFRLVIVSLRPFNIS